MNERVAMAVQQFEEYTGHVVKFRGYQYGLNGGGAQVDKTAADFMPTQDFTVTVVKLADPNNEYDYNRQQAGFSFQAIYYCCGAAFIANINDSGYDHSPNHLKLFEALIEEIARGVSRSLLLYTQRTDSYAATIRHRLENRWTGIGNWYNRNHYGCDITLGGSPLGIYMKDITQPGALTVAGVLSEIKEVEASAAAAKKSTRKEA